MAPVHIFVGGEELHGWTEMTLQRAKKNMTGSLSISMFFSYVPTSPVAITATRGKEVTVYIGGHLAFTGKFDKRTGSGTKKGGKGSSGNPPEGGMRSVSIGAEEYTVRLSARGKTKYLIDSSHQHPTTNMLKPTNKEVVDKLIEPWGIQLDWKATNIKLDKIRLRDGGSVVDELHRVASENSHFMYETRDGKLRVTDDTGRESGEDLILGENILSFSAEQSEEKAKSKVKVKGQRTDKNVRGNDAVIPTLKEIEDKWTGASGALTPFIVQHYGDGTPEALVRRATFEMNKRSSESKTVTVAVFHVQSENGEPWDIGKLHYVEVPPEGIFDQFECVELTYEVKNDKTLKTTMKLSPPPSSSSSGKGGSSLPEIATGVGGLGASRRALSGVTFGPGQYPAPWTGPVLVDLLPTAVVQAVAPLLSGLSKIDNTPILKLPDSFTKGT